MTVGSIKDEIAGPREHCAQRLVERYGVVDLDEARRLYIRHHTKLVKGDDTKMLYGNEETGYVFQLIHRNRCWYVIRRRSRDRNIFLTVTYLTPAQVLWNISQRLKVPLEDPEESTSDDSWLD